MLTILTQGHFGLHSVLGPVAAVRPRPTGPCAGWGLLIALVLFAGGAAAETYDGRQAVIIDGDTIALGSERIRILNIDAPESFRSRCERELAPRRRADPHS
jgi:endonuclease YncB( thermonuclease family)